MPATGRFLLDTNIVIALLEGDDGVSSKLNLASEVFCHELVLVTRDRHFLEVDDLTVATW